MDTKKRETKEALTFGNDKDKQANKGKSPKENNNLNDDSIKQEKDEFDDLLVNEEELIDNSNEGHSFYSKDDLKKQNKGLSKKTKVALISGGVFILLLSIGLGVGYGVNWSGGSSNKIYIIGTDSTEWIEDYIEYNIEDPNGEKAILSAKSIDWAFENLHERGYISDYDYTYVQDKLEKKIEDQVNSEKETYRENYGDSWEQEWEKHLLDLGFDNEDEYIVSLISNEQKTYVDEVFISTGKYFYDYTDDVANLSTKYQSTLYDLNSSGIERYNGLWTVADVDGQTMLFGQNADGDLIINAEFLFDSFLNFYNPIAYNDNLVSFTTPSADLEASSNSSVVFASADELKKNWNFLTDIYLTSYVGINGLTMDITDPDSDYITSNSGVISLKAPNFDENQEVYNTVLLMELDKKADGIYGNDFTTYGVNQLTQSDLVEWTYAINDAMGYAYLDYLSQNPDATSFWPGYDGVNPAPISYTERSNSINEVGASEWDLVEATPAIIDSVEVIFAEDVFTEQMTPITSQEDRVVTFHSTFNYIYDELVVDTLNGNNPVWQEQTTNGDVYITYSTDGLHFITPSTFYEGLNFTTGQTMLISDLDKELADLSGTLPDDQVEPINNISYNILSAYDTWFLSVSQYIYLNSALNNEEFVNDYIIENNPDWSIEDVEKYQEFVQDQYNTLYWNDAGTFIDAYFAVKNYYGNLHKEIFSLNDATDLEIDAFLDIMFNEFVFLTPGIDYTFSLNSTTDILTTGNLNGGGVNKINKTQRERSEVI